MNQPPPLMRDQRKVDADHLRLLAIFHFVSAGFAVIGMLFLLAHYSLVRFFFDNPKLWEGQKGGPPPAEFFAVFKWFYVVFAVWLVVSLVLNLLSGCCLRAKKCRTFSLIVAGVNCIHIPLGTVLGIFTIIVLTRDSVREVYEA